MKPLPHASVAAPKLTNAREIVSAGYKPEVVSRTRLSNQCPIVPTVTVRSGCDHVVVYDQPTDATCVEPQSGPPDAFNLQPHIVATGSHLVRTMVISW